MTPSTFTSPRLERPAEAPLAGVCLALARTTGTDVVLWRVLFVVLTLFGGLGIALYLVAYLAIPKEGEPESFLERLLHGPDRRVSTRQVLLLGLVVLAVAAAVHDNGGLVVAAALGAGYLIWRRRHPTAPVSGATPAGDPSLPAGSAGAPPAASATVPPSAPAAAWQSPAPRPRSVLTPLVLSVASLAVGVLLLVAATGAASVPLETVLAVALGVVGVGLVISAFWGRARGLVPVGVLLALALGATVAARPALDHGVGERSWFAATAGDFQLGIGEATLRLTDGLEAESPLPREITVGVAVGRLVLVVPSDLAVRTTVDVHVTNGEVQGEGVEENGRDVHRRFVFGPEGGPQAHVSARVRVGQVEVRRA